MAATNWSDVYRSLENALISDCPDHKRGIVDYFWSIDDDMPDDIVDILLDRVELLQAQLDRFSDLY